jgi:hypothetical protein
VVNSAILGSSACAREELICAKRASLGTVVLDEAVYFDELGGDIAGATVHGALAYSLRAFVCVSGVARFFAGPGQG